MTKFSLCLASLAALIVPAAHAASFDCSRAARPIEKLICGDPKLNAADERLGQAYRAGLGKLPPAGVGPLRADQVQWLAWMQEICHAPLPSTSPAAATTPSDVSKCMLPLHEQRTKQLRSIAVERDGIRFLTRTQYLAAPEDAKAFGSPEFPGFGTLQVSWPMALNDDPGWQAWNQAIEAEARSTASGDSLLAKGPAAQPVQWTADLAEEADTTVTVHVMRVEHGRVTSSAAMETMGHGAAHPSEAGETMTWLLQAKRGLRADDVFQPGDAWKKMVAKACWTAIQAGEQRTYVYPQVTGPDSSEIQGVIANTGNWTLEHDGLHISYPEYAVSPRIAMLDDTVIPWTALQPVLAKGFIAP